MKKEILYIVPKGTFGDKNDNLQFVGSSDSVDSIKSIVTGISQWAEYPQFKPLGLFIQGDSPHFDNSHWLMIEHWSSNCDLFFEFCEFVSKEFNLPLEIGLPKSFEIY